MAVCSYHVTYAFQMRFRPVSLNDWVFVYELSGCGFESCCNPMDDVTEYGMSKIGVIKLINNNYLKWQNLHMLHISDQLCWFTLEQQVSL